MSRIALQSAFHIRKRNDFFSSDFSTFLKISQLLGKLQRFSRPFRKISRKFFDSYQDLIAFPFSTRQKHFYNLNSNFKSGFSSTFCYSIVGNFLSFPIKKIIFTFLDIKWVIQSQKTLGNSQKLPFCPLIILNLLKMDVENV